jgi:hypothetical protein
LTLNTTYNQIQIHYTMRVHQYKIKTMKNLLFFLIFMMSARIHSQKIAENRIKYGMMVGGGLSSTRSTGYEGFQPEQHQVSSLIFSIFGEKRMNKVLSVTLEAGITIKGVGIFHNPDQESYVYTYSLFQIAPIANVRLNKKWIVSSGIEFGRYLNNNIVLPTLTEKETDLLGVLQATRRINDRIGLGLRGSTSLVPLSTLNLTNDNGVTYGTRKTYFLVGNIFAKVNLL